MNESNIVPAKSMCGSVQTSSGESTLKHERTACDRAQAMHGLSSVPWPNLRRHRRSRNIGFESFRSLNKQVAQPFATQARLQLEQADHKPEQWLAAENMDNPSRARNNQQKRKYRASPGVKAHTPPASSSRTVLQQSHRSSAGGPPVWETQELAKSSSAK